MKRRFLGLLAFCIALTSAAQFTNNRPTEQQANDLQQNIQKLVMASVMINNAYVDSVDTKKMVEDAINGILSKLDPHSAYTNASETKKFTEPLAGSFEGIGVQFNMLDDTLLVIQPVPKGPS